MRGVSKTPGFGFASGAGGAACCDRHNALTVNTANTEKIIRAIFDFNLYPSSNFQVFLKQQETK
jgi:hypothetical protein